MAVKKIMCRQQAVRDAGKLAVFPPLYIQHVIEDRAATCCHAALVLFTYLRPITPAA
jgi:hypothetical protein